MKKLSIGSYDSRLLSSINTSKITWGTPMALAYARLHHAYKIEVFLIAAYFNQIYLLVYKMLTGYNQYLVKKMHS